MALVQNKCDLLGSDGVSADAAEAMARRLRLRVYRTCVREGLNCNAGAPWCCQSQHAREKALVGGSRACILHTVQLAHESCEVLDIVMCKRTAQT